MKYCSKCGEAKTLDRFPKSKSCKGGRHTICQGCQNDYQRSYYKNHSNRLKHSGVTKRWRWKSRYGITPDDYDAMLKSQDGACALCHRHHSRQLQVDHDHSTGKVRALLCEPCNRGLGQFEDDPVVLRRAADYIETHR